MKKFRFLAMAMALLLSLSLAACGQNPAPSAGASSPASAPATQTVTGLVEDAGMSTLTITTAEGATITLLSEDATVESANGLLLGDTVEVTYIGDLQNGAQATNIVVSDAVQASVTGAVISLTDSGLTLKLSNGNSHTFVTTGAQVTGGEPALGDTLEVYYEGALESEPVAKLINVTAAVDGVITGKLADATMNGILVELENGNKYMFSRTEAVVDGMDGLRLGETVEIAYTGHLEDTPSAVLIEILSAAPVEEAASSTASSVASSPASSAASSKPASSKPASSTPAPAPAPAQVKELSGHITDVTGSTMTVYTKGNNSYTFNRKGAILQSETGSLTVGDGVTVTYTGTASRSPKATKIIVTDYAEDSVSSFTGIIYDATSSKLKMQSKHGDVYTFYGLQYADIWHDEDIYIGDKVQIHYTGVIGHSPEVTFIRLLESNSEGSHGSNRISSMSGTVMDATNSGVSVMDSRGNTYFFTREKASVEGGSLLIGDTVTVSYTGELGNNPKATRIVITKSAPVAAGGGTMVGIVDEFSMSTLSIFDANGNAFLFSKENATISGGTPAIGSSVSVTYTGTLGDGPQATYIQILG